jgi:YHS domain-containing protein
MLRQLIFILSLALVLSAFTFAQDQPETTKSDKKDCSHSCCGTKKSNSEANMEKKNEKEVVQIWNKVCPVEGGIVKSESPAFEYNGKLIGFCCEGCGSNFKKNPETYLKNLNEDGSKFIKS